MSAFVVSDAHLNAIVTWANHHKRASRMSSQVNADRPEFLGQMLLDANIESVNYRYAHNKDAQSDPETFVWEPSKARALTPVEALKALQCLEYQCNEVQEWETRAAAKVISALMNAAISELDGYDKAPWSID